jgi:hypothetical protein
MVRAVDPASLTFCSGAQLIARYGRTIWIADAHRDDESVSLYVRMKS